MPDEIQIKEPKSRKKQDSTLTQPQIERVGIEASSIARVQSWLKQSTSQRVGIELSVKKLVNWAIEQIPEVLEPSQLKNLSDQFYDEVKFLESALLQIKEAKTRGEVLSLQDLLHANQALKPRAKTKTSLTGKPASQKGPRSEETPSSSPAQPDLVISENAKSSVSSRCPGT
jgi:hypothetical protein